MKAGKGDPEKKSKKRKPEKDKDVILLRYLPEGKE
jgi:hypothetical protein